MKKYEFPQLGVTRESQRTKIRERRRNSIALFKFVHNSIA